MSWNSPIKCGTGVDFVVNFADVPPLREILLKLCRREDLTRADIDGFILPFVDRLMEMSSQVPEHLAVKIRLCDTMGFGLSYPGAELPRDSPVFGQILDRIAREGPRA